MAEEPIEKKITRILIHRKMTVTAAESCTGGLVAGTLVNADGISEVFKESYVTYSNEAKHKASALFSALLRIMKSTPFSLSAVNGRLSHSQEQESSLPTRQQNTTASFVKQ